LKNPGFPRIFFGIGVPILIVLSPEWYTPSAELIIPPANLDKPSVHLDKLHVNLDIVSEELGKP
jgi:hypothetical protein